MDYFDILHLKREPFSNSPDPDFFYRSVQHTGCLQQLELAIRLRRGLNVVVGHVGTGKTTLCRELIRRFDGENEVATFLVLDPGVDSDSHFLSTVVEQFSGRRPPPDWTDQQKKEAIKQFLFEMGVEEGRTTVLIIDEGQKITPPCLEILREFLNYETNTHKLLQIVIFAQQEFEDTIAGHPNFADRINLRLTLHPLGFRDTLSMIDFRIQASGGGSAGHLFTLPAMAAIFLATRGYPRRIIHLCHRILLTLIIQNRQRVNWRLARASARRTMGRHTATRRRWMAATGAAALIAFFAATPQAWYMRPFDVLKAPTTTRAPSDDSVASEDVSRAALLARAAEQSSPPSSTAASKRPEPLGIGAATTFASQGPAAAPMAARKATPVQPMPARLGRLAVAPRETLGQLIEMIYGRYTPVYLKAIADVNPHIRDTDRLDVGDVIHFPALPAAVHPLPVPVWWIQLGACRKLDDAVAALKQKRRAGLAARLIPYWNQEQDLVFAIVLADCFYDRGVADSTLAQTLPEADRRHAAVRSLWRDDTVFFCDPFRAVKRITGSPS